jgi:hypothetical protein
MEAARIARGKKLLDLQEHLKRITTGDIITITWKEELKHLDSIIVKGTTHEKGWLYGERKTTFK